MGKQETKGGIRRNECPGCGVPPRAQCHGKAPGHSCLLRMQLAQALRMGRLPSPAPGQDPAARAALAAAFDRAQQAVIAATRVCPRCGVVQLVNGRHDCPRMS